MPLGYHSSPTNPSRIGLSDTRPVPAPIHCLPLSGRLVPHAHTSYILRYITLSSASWPRSHWATGGEFPVLLLSYSQPHSGIRCPTHTPARGHGPSRLASHPHSGNSVTHFVSHPHSGPIWGSGSPMHSHLSDDALLGSLRTSFSGSCAALKQHDATCHRS